MDTAPVLAVASRSTAVTVPVIAVVTVAQLTLVRLASEARFTVRVPAELTHAAYRYVPFHAMSASVAPVHPPMFGKLAAEVTPDAELVARITTFVPRTYDAASFVPAISSCGYVTVVALASSVAMFVQLFGKVTPNCEMGNLENVSPVVPLCAASA